MPAAVIVTEPYAAAADALARRLGYSAYPQVVLPHPLASRTDAELADLAAGIIDQVVHLLTMDDGR